MTKDMYRVIFHPQMVAVCEKVNYAAPMAEKGGIQPPLEEKLVASCS